MKRLIFIASLAMLAVGCQKTEIQNEVLTPIGFSTEVGKQTRAIVQDDTYNPDQPFAVYAYGHQDTEVTAVMDNVEVSFTQGDANADPATENKWAATTTTDVKTRYFWPNDPSTTLNFYAYSPAKPKNGNVDSEKAPHQELTGTISHTEDQGLKLTDYMHSNMYVDFMVATPVLEATFKDQDGSNGSASGLKSVPLTFGHKMTQVNFKVQLADEDYSNIDFKINSIVLNNIVSNGTYSYSYTAPADQTPASVTESWSDATTRQTSSYKIYPATTASTQQGDYGYSCGAPALTNVNTTNTEASEVTVILRTDSDTRTTITEDSGVRDLTVAENPGTSFSTTPVTMIPQTLTNTANTTSDDIISNGGQSFTISYTISGTGVATETVTKSFEFADAKTTAPVWGINKNITYTLTISLNEITFEPSVATWSTDNAAGSYVDPEV